MMNEADWTSIAAALISAVIGGVGVACIGHLFNRQRLRAETAKLLAETDKIHAEIRALSATVVSSLPPSTESYVFDGRGHLDGFDIKGREGRLYDADGKPITDIGRGTLTFEDGGILNIQRSNTDGRFELWFKQYVFGGKPHSVIPKDDRIAGHRKLRVSCEAKTVGSDRTLRFVVRDQKTSKRLSQEPIRLSGNSWTSVDVFLEATATCDSELRILKGARLRLFCDRMGSCLADNAFTWMMSRCTSYNVAITANRVSLAMRIVLRICIGSERR